MSSRITILLAVAGLLAACVAVYLLTKSVEATGAAAGAILGLGAARKRQVRLSRKAEAQVHVATVKREQRKQHAETRLREGIEDAEEKAAESATGDRLDADANGWNELFDE